MIKLGLTGSIAMGKSVATGQLRALGIPVDDADYRVHQLLAKSGAGVAPVGAAFPGVVGADGAVDRAKLGAIVFADPKALRKLESILHPLLRRGRDRFLAQARRRRRPIVAFDVPLLYETKAAKAYDKVVVVSCPAFLQNQRAMARPGMTKAKLKGILARQTPDAEKRRRADWVVPTGAGKRVALRRWKQILARIKADA